MEAGKILDHDLACEMFICMPIDTQISFLKAMRPDVQEKFMLEIEAYKKHTSEIKNTDQELLDSPDAIAPGKGISFHKFEHPDYRILKTFDNPNPKNDFEITVPFDELSAVCPLTSYPDLYYIVIKYTPNKACIESKSMKFYFQSFRNEGMFIEALANRIADDWTKACEPKTFKLSITMKARGGIALNVEIKRPSYISFPTGEKK